MPRPTTLTFRSCVVIGHVTVRLAVSVPLVGLLTLFLGSNVSRSRSWPF